MTTRISLLPSHQFTMVKKQGLIMLLLAVCLNPLAANAQPWWVKRPAANWRCCMSAVDNNGFGPAPDGRACAVIDTSSGATCTGVLPAGAVRSRGANANAVCTGDNLGCVDPSDDWSSSFPNYVPPPPKAKNPPPPPPVEPKAPPPPSPTEPKTPPPPPPTEPTTPPTTPGSGGLGGGQTPPPSGGGAGDPHFSGLDGSHFDFHGRKGGFFALLSEAQHQVNALFDNVGEDIYDGVWMTAFGFRFSSNFSLTVSIDKEAYNQRTQLATFETQDGVTRMMPATKADMKLTINGEDSDLLYTGQSDVFETPHGLARVWFPEEFVKHEGDQYDGPLLFLTTPYFDFKLYSESEGTPHLDWRMTVLSDNMDWEEMHGVVGSSINWNGMPQLPGSTQDYEVSSLLANDFTYNCFNGQQGRRLSISHRAHRGSKVGYTAASF